MKTFDIGVDLDGVGYNIHACLAPYARAHGYPLASESRWNQIDPSTGLHQGYQGWGIEDSEEFFALCARAADDDALYAAGAPFPGFVSMTRELAGDGHRLHIVTARPDPHGRVEQATRRWLAEWVIPYRSLELSSAKTNRGMDLFIEDSLFRYEELLDDGMTVPYLVTRPWNAAVQVQHRVGNLAQFVAEVRARARSGRSTAGVDGAARKVMFSGAS